MTSAAGLTIGLLSELGKCSISAIRYYEEVGLLPKASRKQGGHRIYNESDLRRLRFVRRCREFDFSVEETKLLANVFENADRSCAEVRDLAQRHLTSVRAKLAELRALERDLRQFVESCDARCAGGPGPSCQPLQDLTKVSESALTAGSSNAERTSK